MQSKRKMETVRIRKANATIKEEKSVGQTESGVKKETKGADGKVTVTLRRKKKVEL